MSPNCGSQSTGLFHNDRQRWLFPKHSQSTPLHSVVDLSARSEIKSKLLESKGHTERDMVVPTWTYEGFQMGLGHIYCDSDSENPGDSVRNWQLLKIIYFQVMYVFRRATWMVSSNCVLYLCLLIRLAEPPAAQSLRSRLHLENHSTIQDWTCFVFFWRVIILPMSQNFSP